MALIFKDVILDLDKVPDTQKTKVKKEVADFLYNEVLRYVGNGKSPVAGENTNFKILNKAYADREKQGNRKPNLQLEGDLLRVDLRSEALVEADVIRIGHYNVSTADTEGEKADGHNQHTAKAQAWALPTPKKDGKLGKSRPRRRYIPSEGQVFRDDIMDGVKNIISRYETDDTADILADALKAALERSGVSVGQVTAVRTGEAAQAESISIEDVLSDEFIADLIGDRLDGVF